MRKAVAALALTALLPVPSASATHELAAICPFVDSMLPECELALVEGWGLAPCSVLTSREQPTPDGYTVTFLNGYSYWSQAAEVRTTCRLADKAYAIATVPGKVGAIGVALRVTPVKPLATDELCTRWEVRFEPGNTLGLDPTRFYSTPDFCS